MGWLLPLLLVSSTALPFVAAVPAYAACPKSDTIDNGCITNGTVQCDPGYTMAGTSHSVACVKSDTTPSTPPGTCTTGGANDKGCYLNGANCDPTNPKTVCTDPAASGGSDGTNVQCNASSCNLIQKYIDPLVQLLSALVGVAVTISIIIGGIQYGSSAGDPQATMAAKSRIRNSLIALVAFLFLYAFLQFLIPGGLFNGS